MTGGPGTHEGELEGSDPDFNLVEEIPPGPDTPVIKKASKEDQERAWFHDASLGLLGIGSARHEEHASVLMHVFTSKPKLRCYLYSGAQLIGSAAETLVQCHKN